MTNLTESSTWESGIYQLETDDPTLGGPPGFNVGEPVTGHSNAQAQQLANRTKYLYDMKANSSDLSNYSNVSKGSKLVAGAQRVFRPEDYPDWAAGEYASAINSAISDCQSATYGFVQIPAGTFQLEAQIRVFNKTVLRGSGRDRTILLWNGNGPGIYYDPQGVFSPGCHSIEDLQISGGVSEASANPLSIGISISDTFGFRLREVGIFGFFNGVGLLLHNKSQWTEGTILDGVRISRCKYGWQLKREAAATDSFGYTTAYDVSINTLEDGQTGIVVGEPGVNSHNIAVYNSYLLVNIWCSGTGNGIWFAENAKINDSNGYFRCEQAPGASPFTGDFVKYTVKIGSGFENFDGLLRFSPFGKGENEDTKVRDLKYTKVRDIGEYGSGGLRAPIQWFKVAKIGSNYSVFEGTVRVMCNEGLTAYRYGDATFSFGVAGNATGGYSPIFSASGDGWNGNGNNFAQFVLTKETATGDHYLYFKRPAYSSLCIFNYSYEKTYPDRGQTKEIWEKSADPTTIPGLTVVWNSLQYKAQQQYNGDEMVFTGQRKMATVSGNGTTTRFFVPHLLGDAPEYFTAVATSTHACNAEIAQVTATATDVIIDFKVAPVAGTNNITLAVEWARKAFDNRFRPTV